MAGTAIGAAFLIDGKPVLGVCGFAGELGYLPIVLEGRVLRLDEVAGGSFLAAKRGVQPAHLSELAQSGDQRALDLIHDGGTALGLGLAAIINLLNPSRLSVGGGAMNLPGYWQAAQIGAATYSLPEAFASCSLSRVRAGSKVVALGAIRCLLG